MRFLQNLRTGSSPFTRLRMTIALAAGRLGPVLFRTLERQTQERFGASPIAAIGEGEGAAMRFRDLAAKG